MKYHTGNNNFFFYSVSFLFSTFKSGLSIAHQKLQYKVFMWGVWVNLINKINEQIEFKTQISIKC